MLARVRIQYVVHIRNTTMSRAHSNPKRAGHTQLKQSLSQLVRANTNCRSVVYPLSVVMRSNWDFLDVQRVTLIHHW
jgi:hypothetical protein